MTNKRSRSLYTYQICSKIYVCFPYIHMECKSLFWTYCHFLVYDCIKNSSSSWTISPHNFKNSHFPIASTEGDTSYQGRDKIVHFEAVHFLNTSLKFVLIEVNPFFTPLYLKMSNVLCFVTPTSCSLRFFYILLCVLWIHSGVIRLQFMWGLILQCFQSMVNCYI